jgi:hypothetical protein
VVRKSVWRKVAESLAMVAAAVGLMAFGTFGTFEDGDSTFPHTSVGHTR